MLYRKYIKRGLDIVFSIILIIGLSPLLLIVWVLIRLNSKGSGIYKQERVGLNKEPFYIYKFRTMVLGADKFGPASTSNKDSRITKLGKVLRKTSIDELPQIFNILKGEMSFIGPRPDVPQHLPMFSEKHLLKRLKVKPGLTGLSQVNGRSSISLADRIAYDEEYADSLSFVMDVKIIMATIRKIFIKDGVN